MIRMDEGVRVDLEETYTDEQLAGTWAEPEAKEAARPSPDSSTD